MLVLLSTCPFSESMSTTHTPSCRLFVVLTLAFHAALKSFQGEMYCARRYDDSTRFSDRGYTLSLVNFWGNPWICFICLLGWENAEGLNLLLGCLLSNSVGSMAQRNEFYLTGTTPEINVGDGGDFPSRQGLFPVTNFAIPTLAAASF